MRKSKFTRLVLWNFGFNVRAANVSACITANRLTTVWPVFAFFYALTLFSFPQRALGDVVFSVSKVLPGPIYQGGSASFEVMARTNAGTQNFDFITFKVSLSRSDGVGGVFKSFSNYISGPGWAPENSTLAYYDGLSGNGITSLGTSPTALGSITVSAEDAIVLPGEYSISIFEIHMEGGGLIATSPEGPTSYSIAVIPEPSTLVLISAISIGAAGVRFRRRFSRSR